MPNTDLIALREFFRKHSGYNVRDDQRHVVESHLKPILDSYKLCSLDALALELKRDEHSPLAKAAVEAMAIHETMFFRDTRPFDMLIETILPRVIAEKPKGSRINIWSAACSSGQEAYSIAIAIDKHRNKFPNLDYHVTGTDLSSNIIEHAKKGIYNDFEVSRGLCPKLKEHYFIPAEDNKWRIADSIKERTSFAVMNLMNIHPNFGKFDIIFCRNVLIYFEAEGKLRALTNIHKHCAPNAYLLVGAVDLIQQPHLFTPTDQHALYQVAGKQG